MKTMKNYDKIVRIADKDVNKYLENNFHFITKKQWKEELRDYNKKRVDKSIIDLEEESDVKKDKKLTKNKK